MNRLIRMRIPRPFVLILALLCLGTVAGQQVSTGGDFWSRVRYGGGLGLAFGNRSVQVSVTPSAIYQVNNYLALGTGLNYTYSKFDDARFSAYGGSILALANPIRQIQLSAEFEELRVRRTWELPGGDIRDSYWLPALYAGIGFSTGPVTLGIRYDLLHDDDRSLYADPWIPFVRVYF